MAKILVVDDEDHIRFLIRKVLESKGHTIIEARDGTQALRILDESSGSIDLIALDIRMPHMDGITLLTLLENREYHPPVIVLTAHLDKLPAAVEHHISGHIVKPFSRHKLVDMVSSVLHAQTT